MKQNLTTAHESPNPPLLKWGWEVLSEANG